MCLQLKYTSVIWHQMMNLVNLGAFDGGNSATAYFYLTATAAT
jgi:hypothetical protein